MESAEMGAVSRTPRKFVDQWKWSSFNTDVLVEMIEARDAAIRKESAPKWISVEERLPESGIFVFANIKEIKHPIRAFYAAPNSVEGSCEDEISVYNEETDCYWLPEGWYKANECGEAYWFVYNNITHLMPLPEPPDRAAIEGKEGEV
jgi:hypothetical protein